MTPERWQQIEQLLHAALERGPAERAALLERECATDPDLREEVESLLSSAKQTDGFLAANAAADGAVLLADDPPSERPGSRIGPYSIQKQLGARGMGKVYLAEDIRLGRKVALKLLDPSLTSDGQSRLRFLREARLAATLDHPNICTVHEVGEAGGRPFIAMQFVEGETLRQAIGGRPMSLESLLSISLQVADALAAAQAQGIIHRDIKAGNIMVTPRGQAKVLDFGLAKLLERTEGEAESHMTMSGVVLGTPASMSPEQARGEQVDRRSDVFSFGVVLYEMATGRTPFGGRSKADLISALLNQPHTPVAEVNQEIPPRLSAVIDRMLAKEPADRYQSMPELLSDLRQVVGEVGGMDRLFSSSDPPQGMMPLVPPQRLNSAQPIAPSVTPKRLSRRVALAVTGVLLFVVVAAAGFGFWSRRKENKQTRPVNVPFALAVSKQLTTKGKVGWAALSADGKFYAYVLIERDVRQESLWVGQTDAGNDIQLRPAAGEYKGLAFSPDGKFLYFSLKDESRGGLFKIPLLGGRSEKLPYDLETSFTLSPDGKQIAFLRPVKETNAPTTLVIANLDGGPERELLQRPPETSFSLNCLAWSPDSSKIAVAAVSDGTRAARELFVVRTTDGQVEQLTTSEWSRISNVVWQGDAQGLILVATNKGETFRHLWQVDYPAGTPHRLSRDIDEYGAPLSLSSAADSLVAVQIKRESNIWIGPADDLSKAHQVTFSSINGIYGWEGFDWMPDGGKVFTAGIDRSLAIYSMDAGAGNIKQITSSGFNDQRPRVTPDGRYVVFQSNRSNGNEIWRVRSDGTDLIQLTTGGNNSSPDLAPDGKWVFYSTIRDGKSFVWRVSIEGGEPVQVTTTDSYHPAASPDGKLIAYTYETEGRTSFKIAIVKLDDAAPVKLFDVPRFASFSGGVRWSPDGKAVIYRDRERGIWRQDLSGGQPKRLEGIPNEDIIRFGWSRDGKEFAFVRGRIISDAVLFRDVR